MPAAKTPRHETCCQPHWWFTDRHASFRYWLCVCVCLSVCLPACLPVCLSVCLSVCLLRTPVFRMTLLDQPLFVVNLGWAWIQILALKMMFQKMLPVSLWKGTNVKMRDRDQSLTQYFIKHCPPPFHFKYFCRVGIFHVDPIFRTILSEVSVESGVDMGNAKPCPRWCWGWFMSYLISSWFHTLYTWGSSTIQLVIDHWRPVQFHLGCSWCCLGCCWNGWVGTIIYIYVYTWKWIWAVI